MHHSAAVLSASFKNLNSCQKKKKKSAVKCKYYSSIEKRTYIASYFCYVKILLREPTRRGISPTSARPDQTKRGTQGTVK
jgi:hypothetical protein